LASTRFVFLAVLGAGVVLVVLYYLLSAFHVGGIGAPTDIGGGLVALASYALLITGLVGFLVCLVVGKVSARRAASR
jgi:hypothetical protein